MGRKNIRCHGDTNRFQVMADFIYETYSSSVKYIADVAGGQGMLTKCLNKYNYESEVIDPREYTIKGISHRQSDYEPQMAEYYDLIVGLHPDQATRAVVESALYRPIIVVPCCNFWDTSKKLGRDAMISSIAEYLRDNKVSFEIKEFNFIGPKNIGIITY